MKRKKERVEAERSRVKRIWEEMLVSRKESTLKEFRAKEKQLSDAQAREAQTLVDQSNVEKSYIKLPKHYQPNLLMRMY